MNVAITVETSPQIFYREGLYYAAKTGKSTPTPPQDECLTAILNLVVTVMVSIRNPNGLSFEED
jgi:hypothetical protein